MLQALEDAVGEKEKKQKQEDAEEDEGEAQRPEGSAGRPEEPKSKRSQVGERLGELPSWSDEVLKWVEKAFQLWRIFMDEQLRMTTVLELIADRLMQDEAYKPRLGELEDHEGDSDEYNKEEEEMEAAEVVRLWGEEERSLEGEDMEV